MADLRPPRGRQTLADLQRALRPVARPNPLVLLWRWRYELGILAGIPAGVAALAQLAPVGWVCGAAGLLAGALVTVPATRQALVKRAWCVITPHRVRTGCAQAWIHSRTGRLPAVMLTTRQPYGERVLLWTRAGTSAADFETARDQLAAACWAGDVVVTRSERFAHLITLDVIRRAWPGDPLDAERDDQPGTAEIPELPWDRSGGNASTAEMHPEGAAAEHG